MEIKVFRTGCRVESVQVPPLVGVSRTREHDVPGADLVDGTDTTSSLDGIMAVSEAFSYSPGDGGVLVRTLRTKAGQRYANGTRDMVVIPQHDESVIRVDVDGETVWPEDNGGGSDATLDRIDDMLAGMDAEDGQPAPDEDPYGSEATWQPHATHRRLKRQK